MSNGDEPLIDDVSGVEERPQNRREWSGVLRSLLLPVVIVATIVGALFYVEQRRGGSSAAVDGIGTVDLPDGLNPTGRSPSTDAGRAAPDFVLETPAGGTLRMSDLRGTPLLVNFWASWCTECRQEMPLIVGAYGRRQLPGFQVVAVNLQENEDQVRSFASDYGMTFPVVIDRTGNVGDAWRIGGPIEGIPASYFVDKDGIVQARVFGPLTQETLTANLAKIGVQQ